MWIVHWGLAPEAILEDVGLARCGGGATAWVAGVLAAQVLRGVGSYGSRKYSALGGYGNQYWPVRSSILAWRTP